MKRFLICLVVLVAAHLGFRIMEPCFTETEMSQGYFHDFNDRQFEAMISAQSGDMILPFLVNHISAPAIHLTTARKIQNHLNNTLTIRRLSSYFKTFNPKNPSQITSCFVSPNDSFVVLLRHLII